MQAIARRLLLAALIALPHAAAAQDDEARASALREAGRAALREGRIEGAFESFREAAALTRDPSVWLEVGDAADRLRVDDVALSAYERYLALDTDAPDRAEIEGRVRVLRELASGRRCSAPPTGRALVDWNGRPIVMRRPTQLVSLAEWDGAMGQPGLGRRLSPP